MSGRLTKNMYAEGAGLFGLKNGQIRAYSVIKNAGWYNQDGEKLGNGDLSQDDIDEVAVSLQSGESFIALSERDSSYGMPEHENQWQLSEYYLKKHARLWIEPLHVRYLL